MKKMTSEWRNASINSPLKYTGPLSYTRVTWITSNCIYNVFRREVWILSAMWKLEENVLGSVKIQYWISNCVGQPETGKTASLSNLWHRRWKYSGIKFSIFNIVHVHSRTWKTTFVWNTWLCAGIRELEKRHDIKLNLWFWACTVYPGNEKLLWHQTCDCARVSWNLKNYIHNKLVFVQGYPGTRKTTLIPNL